MKNRTMHLLLCLTIFGCATQSRDSVYVYMAPLEQDGIETTATTTQKPIKKRECTLYSASWCSNCPKAKAFLESRGIKYTVVDIERNEPDSKTKAFIEKYGIPCVKLPNGKLLNATNIYSEM